MEYKTDFYALSKKIENARRKGFVFNQINKLTKKVYCNLSKINVHYYLKHRFPVCNRQFFRMLPQNPDYVKTQCSNIKIPFHLACRKWYLHKNPQC